MGEKNEIITGNINNYSYNAFYYINNYSYSAFYYINNYSSQRFLLTLLLLDSDIIIDKFWVLHLNNNNNKYLYSAFLWNNLKRCTYRYVLMYRKCFLFLPFYFYSVDRIYFFKIFVKFWRIFRKSWRNVFYVIAASNISSLYQKSSAPNIEWSMRSISLCELKALHNYSLE